MAPKKKEEVTPEEEERLSDTADEADVEAEDEDTDTADEADVESESDADAEDDADEEPVKPVKKAPAKKSSGAKSSGKKAPARLEESSEEEAEDEAEDTDYLQQYQYKKVNDVPTIGGVLTNPDQGSKAEKMKNILLSQPRVRILVARDPGEHQSVLMSVNLNGYRLDFPKNTYIEMPEQVAEVIMQSQKQTDVALDNFRIDSDVKRKALNA